MNSFHPCAQPRLLRMPLFRSKTAPLTPPVKRFEGNGNGGGVDILKRIPMHGIGVSGPCQTPDFVPASIFLHVPTKKIVNSDDTTVNESILDLSSKYETLSTRQQSPRRRTNQRVHLTDVDVNLRRGKKGLGLRLIGGAEEGTQVGDFSSKSWAW